MLCQSKTIKNHDLQGLKRILPPYSFKLLLTIFIQIVKHGDKQPVNNIHHLHKKHQLIGKSPQSLYSNAKHKKSQTLPQNSAS